MAKNSCLDARAKEFILRQMHDSGEMTKDEIKDLIRPHFSFDYQAAREQAIGRYANRLVSGMKNERGERNCFLLRGEGLVVNVDKCKSLRNVRAVREQLRKQVMGTYASYRKVARRAAELEGQVTLFDAEEPGDVVRFAEVVGQ